MEESVPLNTPQTVFRVAAWWPAGGYGGTTDHATLEGAMAVKAALEAKGYPNVRVWKVTTEWIAR